MAAIIQEAKIKQISLKRYRSTRLAPLLRVLKHSKNLEKITLLFEPVDEEIESLACALSNENLKHFVINHVWDVNRTNFWPPIIPVLSEHKSLTNLTLWTFGSGEYDAINQVLQRNTSIRELTLCDNQVEPTPVPMEEIQFLLDGLKYNTTLKSLYLAHLSNESVDLLCKSLGQNQINITELKLAHVTLSEDNCRVLNEALKTNMTVTDLDLTWCEIDDAKCQLLIDGFLKRTKLTLYRCTLTAASTKPLFEQLKGNKTLTSLTLSMTDIAADSCKFIADMLVHNTSLKSLSLYLNRVEDEGIICICEAMLNNTTLVDLNVDETYFGVAGMTAVKNVLTHNTTLRKFSTYCNPESEESVKLLSEGLKQNTSLNSIAISPKISGRRSNEPIHIAMRDVLEVNYALDTVQLNGDTTHLTPLLKRNRQLKSETQLKVAILSHNIARSREALAMLPREVWIEILSLVTHPGMEPSTAMVKKIFEAESANTHFNTLA